MTDKGQGNQSVSIATPLLAANNTHLLMKRFISIIASAGVMSTLISCAADSTPTNSCPPAATLLDKTGWELGAGEYRVRRDGNNVIVSATGQSSTAGVQVQLAREPMKIFPPQFALHRKRPAGFAAQVITPFSVCTSFKANTPVDFVIVRDSKGEHRVRVELQQQ